MHFVSQNKHFSTFGSFILKSIAFFPQMVKCLKLYMYTHIHFTGVLMFVFLTTTANCSDSASSSYSSFISDNVFHLFLLRQQLQQTLKTHSSCLAQGKDDVSFTVLVNQMFSNTVLATV